MAASRLSKLSHLRHRVVGGNQAGAGPRIATALAIDLLALARPAVRPVAAGLKAALIEIDQALRPTLADNLAQRATIGQALLKVAFGVTQRFFYG